MSDASSTGAWRRFGCSGDPPPANEAACARLDPEMFWGCGGDDPFRLDNRPHRATYYLHYDEIERRCTADDAMEVDRG